MKQSAEKAEKTDPSGAEAPLMTKTKNFCGAAKAAPVRSL
jgi:hypothetical protein